MSEKEGRRQKAEGRREEYNNTFVVDPGAPSYLDRLVLLQIAVRNIKPKAQSDEGVTISSEDWQKIQNLIGGAP